MNTKGFLYDVFQFGKNWASRVGLVVILVTLRLRHQYAGGLHTFQFTVDSSLSHTGMAHNFIEIETFFRATI